MKSFALMGLLGLMVITQQTCGSDDDDDSTSSDFPVDIEAWYLLGANYPWNYYGFDVGINAWGHYGVSSGAGEAVAADFSYLKSQGVHVVRLFIFADGRAAPEFDTAGAVTGLDAYVFPDFDQLLDYAHGQDLYLVPVLLDFYWCDSAEEVNGVQIGGHSDVIEDSEKTRTFIDAALIPMLERYGTDDHILAWEVINEPEWAMDNNGGGLIGDPVSADAMASFVSSVLETIHEYAVQPVTLGSATKGWMQYYWFDLPFDLQQYHYYSDQPFTDEASDLSTAVPVMVGEFPSVNGSMTMTGYLDAIYGGGFGGALTWSLNAEDDVSGFESVADEFYAWSISHQSEVAIVPIE